jgi:hypothetical protein
VICYKDRTFCVQDTCAKRDTCGNYLSEGHKRNAEKSGLPIAQALYLGCFVAESTQPIAQGATNAGHKNDNTRLVSLSVYKNQR